MISKTEQDAWNLLRKCIKNNYQKVNLNNNIYEVVSLLDKLFEIEDDTMYKTFEFEHVCGLQGFGRGLDSKYDRCIACEIRENK